jgi:hypothetical protein
MISRWLQRLRGGDGSSTESTQPATAPEPESMPVEPTAPPVQPTAPPTEPGAASEEPAGDEPA